MTDTDTHVDQAAPRAPGALHAGVVTLAVVVLAFLAFDDITTNSATRFPLEYSWLLGSAVWCLVVAVRLARTGHRVLGTVSLLAIGGAAWGGPAIGVRNVAGLQLEYAATLAGLIWFFVLSIILVLLGVRGNRASRTSAMSSYRAPHNA